VSERGNRDETRGSERRGGSGGEERSGEERRGEAGSALHAAGVWVWAVEERRVNPDERGPGDRQQCPTT